MTASREITAEGGSAVPLRVDRVADDPAEPVCMLHCTDIEGTELRVAVREPSAAGLPPEAGEWYRFDGVARSGSPRSALVVPADRGGVERIDGHTRRGPTSTTRGWSSWGRARRSSP
jgi:hypothetical protein